MRQKSTLTLFVVMLCLSSIHSTTISSEIYPAITIDSLTLLTAPLDINDNADLVAASTGGSGTANDPYIISGYNFTFATVQPAFLAIDASITEYYIIKDNYFNGLGAQKHAIQISTTPKAVIINNTISNFGGFGSPISAIHLNGMTKGVTLENNTITNVHGEALFIRATQDVNLHNNTFNNVENGIRLEELSDVSLTDNAILNSYNGFQFQNGYDVFGNYTVTGNYFENIDQYAIETLCTPYACALAANYKNMTISENEFHNTRGMIGVNWDNATISDNIMTHDNSLSQFYLRSSGNSTIQGNTLQGGYIHTYDVFNVSIYDNTITNYTHTNPAIINNNANLTRISSNYVQGSGNQNGIDTRFSTNVTIMSNYISNTTNGIRIYKTTNTSILENTVENNLYYGIYLDTEINKSSVQTNILRYNNYGLGILNSEDNYLAYNLVYLNNLYGLDVVDSDLDIVTFNDFVGNNLMDTTIQARIVNGNTSVISNFWNDWTSPDANTDDIVDNPYQFNGGQDPTPLALPAYWSIAAAPAIKPLSNATYNLGDLTTLSWYVSGNDPLTYKIVVDTIIFASGSISPVENANTIDFNVSSLDVGLHNVSIEVVDQAGLSSVSTIFLTILQDNISPNAINSQSNSTIDVGSSKFLSFGFADNNPTTYNFYQNGTVVASGSWLSGEYIDYVFNGTSPGIFNITLVVMDIAGNTAIMTVFITVNPDVTVPIFTDKLAFLQYNEGTEDNILSFTAFDDNLESYIILKDNVEIKNGVFNSTQETLTINIDGLQPGDYNYTVVLYDAWGNSYASETIVTVLADTTSPFISWLDTIDMVEGETRQLEYNVEDLNPATYTITQDGVDVASGSWQDGDVITYDLSSLPVGQYIFVFTASDIRGNTATGQTTVTVNSNEDTSQSESNPVDEEGSFLPFYFPIVPFVLLMIAIRFVKRKI